MARMTTARAIVRSLVANGVDTVFGLPGVQLDALFNALHDERNRIRLRSGVPRPVAIESPTDVLGLEADIEGIERVPGAAAAHCMRGMRSVRWQRRCRPGHLPSDGPRHPRRPSSA